MSPDLPRAILWDLDGVLVDTFELHFLTWREALSREGIAFTRTTFDHTFGQNNHDTLTYVLGHPPTPEQEERISACKEGTFRQEARRSTRAMPGVDDLIRALHADGWRQAVASSAPPENISVLMACLEAADLLRVHVSGDLVPIGKPDPTIFLLAARELSVPPARCVVIEDAPAGVQAAARAGMACLALTSTRPAEALAGATWIVDSLVGVSPADLAALLPSPR
jgi:HAD superfamily hydrolase (TIGR01509 family)